MDQHRSRWPESRRAHFSWSAIALTTALACGDSDKPLWIDGEPRGFGTLSIALAATGGEGTAYRLTDATFIITGPEQVTLEPSDDDASATVDVVVGSYQVELASGWRMERMAEASFEPVPATLVSANPVDVEVVEQAVSAASFEFRAGDDLIDFGHGRIAISIEVNAESQSTRDIACGTQTCEFRPSMCCMATEDAAFCALPDNCAVGNPAAIFGCDETADCEGGRVCCVSLAAIASSGCALDCPSTATLCAPEADDCPDGLTCVILSGLGVVPDGVLKGICQ